MPDQENDSTQLTPREIEVCEYIGGYLDESNDDKKMRLAKITTLRNFLAFERRFTELTDAEREHYSRCLNGPVLSEAMRKTLDGCETEEERSRFLNMWARATYFIRCAWETYLHTGKDKPQIPQQEVSSSVEDDTD